MNLSPEDALRLNVLLNQELFALRIDEGKRLVTGLTPRGEAKVPLNPNCAEEKYLRQVREMISNHVLGSPHGYPRFMHRWTRMGHARAESLTKLLRLGEPEAVAAVVHAEGLTDEIARHAWWVDQSPDHARAMLAREQVARGEMGKVLADFLVEFLPYEEDTQRVVESVRLVLQPGLVDDATRTQLWARGQRKPAYRVGFLKTLPDDLPVEAVPHPRFAALEPVLGELAATGNEHARLLARVLAAPGQAWLETVEGVFRRCADQGVVIQLFEAIEAYFAPIKPPDVRYRDMTPLLQYCAQPEDCVNDARLCRELAALKARLPEEDLPLLESLRVCACVGEQLIAPIFGLSDSVGPALRQSIEPVIDPLMPHLNRLRGR
ncbi:DsrS [Thioalkalivibrio denitrificans]|uniref:DsrS n=2 Tax=Thioalkalivibrio denitrificans TaxID=108003 RepID=A0A1V3NRX0_9GAMM|nr:DsrS [Thioalkalivibrio denitrificans]